MGTHGVVANLPLSELAAEVSDGRGGAATLVELLGMGPLGSLHVTIQLGAVRRQHQQPDLPLLTETFELGHELRATVYLNGADREGGAIQHPLEALFGR